MKRVQTYFTVFERLTNIHIYVYTKMFLSMYISWVSKLCINIPDKISLKLVHNRPVRTWWTHSALFWHRGCTSLPFSAGRKLPDTICRLLAFLCILRPLFHGFDWQVIHFGRENRSKLLICFLWKTVYYKHEFMWRCF